MTEFASGTPLNPVEFMRDGIDRYPEMVMLTGSALLATPGQPTMLEASSIGSQLFPDATEADIREFNRTATALLTMEWVLNGDYESFTACQQGPDKLTPESFAGLKSYTESILVDGDAKEALEVSLVINDLGKIDSVIERLARATGTQEVDHDKILLEALERFPAVSPSFERLTPHYKQVILEGLRAQFNLGQFMQGENVPASLAGLRGIRREALDFYNLHLLFDIAGAAGQIRQDGSLTFTEPTCQNFVMAVSALEGVNDQPLTKTYDAYLRQKAEQLGIQDVASAAGRAITRLCCMLRYSRPEQAWAVSDAFDRLPEAVRATLEGEMSRTGVDDGYATLIYYAPAILNNLQRAYGERAVAAKMHSQEAFERALSIGCTALSELFSQARAQMAEQRGSGVFTVLAADVASAVGKLDRYPVTVERIEGTNTAVAKFSTD